MHTEIASLAISIQAFCAGVQSALASDGFAPKCQLIELLVDRVIVKDSVVQICYPIATSPGSEHCSFFRWRADCFISNTSPS
ncbi:hypothetical protein [Polaromonas sp. CG_9.11]|uniref:hypothetical protein n=1 Tax=Polaromonas sp. CG_9.11 TaxID=2787730 RepID=UPI001A272F5E|nr:hypothetical protein [Polaromonas sp. CG_9.11]MBG6076212.1 hypothetical protein [Polaromonas sp. CG_9.11]